MLFFYWLKNIMKKIIYSLFCLIIISCTSVAQESEHKNGYWQQKVDYTMDIDMNVNNFQYTGKQKLVYTNNSPDVLDKVFYHLYFNAFQPGSQMNARLENIPDPSRKMADFVGTRENPVYKSRITPLTDSEIGYINVNSLTQDEITVKYETVGTVLEVQLNKPIKPGESTTFYMEFDAQVPVMIRRGGRNSKEGVALSMTQWYPKMAEYDYEGWHTPPYIAREFHGVWGNFDVTINIDKKYMIGGTGTLKNPQEVGHGYEDVSKPLQLPSGKKLKWHFKGENIHDFAWGADPEFTHDIFTMENGVDLHFFYKKNLEEKYLEGWKKLQPKTAELMEYFSQHIGQYPYKQYSVIQGGDGGMEYAQCTLITGKRKWGSLFGVTAHELAHTWFQFLLATNESKYAWMDEGFTTYISNKAVDKILEKNEENPHEGSYNHYQYIINRGLEEPLTTHADRFHTNVAYSVASYSKGNIFLIQLEQVIGQENVAKALQEYFKDFSFKHPTANDFVRIAEKVSGIHLGWYKNEWIETTNVIDYGIKTVNDKSITLERLGEMPMPVDVEVVFKDGSTQEFHIPLEIMRGHKPTDAKILKDWGWAYPTYTFEVDKKIKSVQINKLGFIADVNRENDFYQE